MTHNKVVHVGFKASCRGSILCHKMCKVLIFLNLLKNDQN